MLCVSHATWHRPVLSSAGKHNAALEALKEQELDDARMQLLQEDKKFVDNKTVTIRSQDGLPEKARIVPKEVLPGYMIKLTAGYEYRTYWFEVCRVNSQGILLLRF